MLEASRKYKTAYIAVTDYAPGHDSEAAFEKAFTEGGGKVVGKVRIPLANPDFVPFLQRVKDASNMTDRFNALSALVGAGHALAATALERFHQLFKNEALVLDKWFALQAMRQHDPSGKHPVINDILHLRRHPDFNIKNPNRARSLIHAFCLSNPGAFHQAGQDAYKFWAQHVIELNAINPQVAARLARGMDRWKQFAPSYQDQMKSALESVNAEKNLSSDVSEIIHKALNS